MRKFTALFVSLMMVLTCSLTFAETKITVTGTGNTLVSADTAIISLGVSVRDKDVSKAQQKANEIIAAIRTALTENGIPSEDINTGYLNIYAMYDYTNDMEVISAYNANSTLAIRVSDMTIVGEVIDLAFGAGANVLNGIEFSASDTTDARAESLKAAVQDAQAKAQILAEASGLTIKGIESISENNTYSYDSGLNNFSKTAGAVEDAKTVVQAAKLQVTANVTITFETDEHQ